MFSEYALGEDLIELCENTDCDTLVVESQRDFEALPEDALFEVALLTEDISPTPCPESWLSEDSPQTLSRLTKNDLAIGLPGDGSVTWTAQTTPPLIIIKPRIAGAPTDFKDFLIAEAILQLSRDHPEHLLSFFREDYRSLEGAVNGDSDLSYRLAIALYRGWQGLDTRASFQTWEEKYPRLGAAWSSAGGHLEGRVSELPTLLADGTMGFGAATELACSALKHDISLPAPFRALDVESFRDHGARFAIKWAERTYAQLATTQS